MAQLAGVFSSFTNLDKIPLEDINRWLKDKSEVHSLLNHIGNLIQYPQVIPVRKEELELDWAILTEVLRREYKAVLKIDKEKVILNKELVYRFPPVERLLFLISSTILLPEQVSVISEERTIAMIVTPVLETKETQVSINNKKANNGSILLLSGNGQPVQIVAGEKRINVKGGEMGVVVDLRKVKQQEQQS